MPKFRKGDVVSIDVVVESNPFGQGDVRVRTHGGYTDIYAKASQLTMKRPMIEVGDTVRCPTNGTATATVLSVAEEHVWVSLGNGDYATWWVPKVERVEPEPDADEPSAEAA